jgi:dihydroflavonol-4-reductase
MKTLVTGAAGFIGSSVVRELMADGQEVRAMILPGEDQRNIQGLDMEVVEGDILDTDSLHRALTGCNKLYQLAAVYRYWHPRGGDFIRRVNIGGTRNILEAALRHDLERVIYTSSISSLGFHKGRPSREDDFPEEEDLRRMPYRESKYKSELIAHEYAEKMPIVIVNPAAPIGVRDWVPTPTGRSVLDFLNGKMFAYIDVGVNMIDVEDLAKGFLLAEKNGKFGERYVLGNANIMIKEFFDMIAEVTGLNPPSLKFPKPLLRMVAEVNQLISDITKKEPLASVEHALHVTYKEFADCSKAVQELGLPRNDLRIAIYKACKYYLDTGAVKRHRAELINLKQFLK